MLTTFNRRILIRSLTAFLLAPRNLRAVPTGERLATAARNQIGVTLTYDPNWSHIPYPDGDVPRSTGVCADVVIRAARDAFNLDLQKLVHEDMLKDFAAYPARKTWGTHHPDSNIDHRRVLNLEVYWRRVGCELWYANQPTPGDSFPQPLVIGDILTWMLDARLPHVGILVSTTPSTLVHNIGNGVELCQLTALHPHRASGHYRYPKA